MASTQWSPPTASQTQSGCLNTFLFVAASAWLALVTVAGQAIAWFYDQFNQTQGTPTSGWTWVLITASLALLQALLVVPLALAVRAPRFRAAYRTWALAIGFGLLLSLARLCPVTWTQPAAVVQIVLTLLATFGLMKLRIEKEKLRNALAPFSILGLALAIGLMVDLPWFRYGALGSPIDTLLNLLASLSLGLFAGVLLAEFLVAPLAAYRSGAADIAFGSFAAGVALLILGAGFGYGGSQILLMLCLAPLGLAAPALARSVAESTENTAGTIGDGTSQRSAISAASVVNKSWLPIAGLVGVAAAGPLLFVDPDEFSLIVDDTIGLDMRAALYAFLIACVIGLLLWAVSALLGGPPRRSVALGALATAVAGALLVYFLAGHPGFYGEQLFVILRDQADVSSAVSIADRDERIRYVYTTLTQHADRTQANLRATLDRLGVAYRPYYLVNAIEVDGGPLLRAYLAAQPEVDRILDSPHLRPIDAPLQLDLAPPDVDTPPPPSGVQWNIRAIGADRVWSELGATGQGIVVGESDSGVQGDHPALRDGYRGHGGQNDYNWIDPWNHSPAPVDISGHGTHTTGSALGRGGIGVAPGAEWIGCVNLARNLGNPPFYLNCMQFMLAPYPQSGDPFKDGRPQLAAHVLNNSWGCPPVEGCDPGSLEPAVRALRAAGIFVVASAGNEGPGCGSVSDPIAIYSEAFSVGAIDRAGDIADFSSRGPVTVDGSGRVKPDILAPGVDVQSAWPGGTYYVAGGTSMAGPHIAGVVALMWSAQPKLIGNIERTEQILRATARPYNGARTGCSAGAIPSDDAGYGVVDAYAAVQAALAEP
jgi:hypothetical protein